MNTRGLKCLLILCVNSHYNRKKFTLYVLTKWSTFLL
nr:MAG TPA: hypothetical protein [Caudoviricetes sp.]